MYKQLLSAAAIVLTFALFFPYIRSINRGETKPHVFSWVIWGLGTLIVFFAQLASAAAIVLTFALFFPYIRSINRGETKPHVFSWVIWGLGTLIVFFAQLAGRGGLGAWVIGVSGLITSYIALLAYLKRGDTVITETDWVFFL